MLSRTTAKPLLPESARLSFNILTPAILVLCLTLSAACAPSPARKLDAQNGSLKIRYTDGVGRQVELPRHPKRIISLAPDVTELIFLLNAGERLMGVTTHCNWPELAGRLPKIGDLLNPNYELILAAKPDLVIGSTAGNDRSAILKLEGLGVPVYVTAPRSVKSIYETVISVGRIVGCDARAAVLVTQMQGRLEELKRRLSGLPKTHAFFMTWFDPLLAPGKNTFENDVLREAGVDSLTSEIEEFYPRYSLEQLIQQDPDVLITVEHTGRSLPDLKQTPGWRRLKAVNGGRVYILNEVFQHPSPRFIDGVEELARKMHPERFR
jgi:iron complex transport system substrate-binding protein